MRIDKPTGSWLLFLPGTWGIAMASSPSLDLPLIVTFGVGAVLMRGAGCTINDLWDQNFDKRVERTKTRPLARGAISQLHALGFLGAQLTVGLWILLTLNNYRFVTLFFFFFFFF